MEKFNGMSYEDAEQKEEERVKRNKIASDIYLQISKNLHGVMRDKGLKEADVIRICRDLDYPISQSAVSKILSYPEMKEGKEEFYSITLINFIQICKALEVDPGYILNMDSDLELHNMLQKNSLRKSKRDPLVFKMDEDEFNGYKGEYYCYFFPTISSESKLLEGKLNFKQSKVGEYCEAHFKLDTNKYYDAERKEKIYKEYRGELIISVRMGSCYCLLHNTDIGEICFLIFHHMYLNNEQLKCRLCTAATASAGDNRRPTIHRMLISRDPIPGEHLKLLKSQLLLNNSEILISSNNLEKLKTQEEDTLPPEVEKMFQTSIQKEEYYKLSEFQIRALDIPPVDKLRAICLLRNWSTAPKYNKIGSKCDELLFDYLSKIQTLPSDTDTTASASTFPHEKS